VAAPRVKTAPRRAPQPRRKPAAAPLVRRLATGRTGALLDGLLRGRACVGIVFVLLVGVVFANVSLLEMNKGIAATNAQATAMEQENAKLRRQIAPLASSERIQTEAVKHGYSLPAAGDVVFIRGNTKANAKKAAGRITAPGMGEGTASRPAAQVQQEQQTAMQAQNPTAPVTAAPSPEPVTQAQPTPATGATPTMAPTAAPPAVTPPSASPMAPSPGTAP
jgi:cell division protein FtsL